MVRDNFQEQPDKTPSSARQESPDPFSDVRQFALLGKQEQRAPRESEERFERAANTSSAYAAVLSLGTKPHGVAALGQRIFELQGTARVVPISPYSLSTSLLNFPTRGAYPEVPRQPAQVQPPDWVLTPSWTSRPQEDFTPQRPTDINNRPRLDVQRPTDVPAWQSNATTRPELFELRLRHRTGNHGKADAVVYVPAGFDRSKPVNVVVYNHGHNNDAANCFNSAGLAKQLEQAPANTILIIPEWQKTPHTANSAMGNAGESGYFRGMFEEVFERTPALSGLRLDDVQGISIYSHSAGYNPTIKQLYNNGLGDKIKSVTMLDSLYDGTAFDPWIQQNIHELAAGRKRFENFYSGTAEQSLSQARRIDQMLQRAGLPRDAMIVQDKGGQYVMDSNTIANHGIVFKRSTTSVRGQGAHSAVASIYVGQTMDARRRARA